MTILIDLGVFSLIILMCIIAYRFDRRMVRWFENRRKPIRLVYSAREADKPPRVED